MSVPFQFRRMTSTLRLGLIPLFGELIFDSDVRKPFMGDGTTVGGVPVDGALTTGNNSASYAIVQGDVGKSFVFTYNSGSIAVALAEADSSSGQYFPDGCLIWISNQSASQTLTITPATSTINGAATLVLHPGDSAKIVSDGINYWAVKCVVSLAGLSDVTITSPSNGQVLAYNGSRWVNSSATGGGGLWAPLLATIPTSVNTGLTTWLNQGGASVANVATGLSITTPASASPNIRGRYGAVPSTPYDRKFLIGLNSIVMEGLSVAAGWYDGTNKIQYIGFEYDGSGIPGVVGINVFHFSNPTTFVGSDFSGNGKFPNISLPIWFHLADDGTTVSFGWSMDGIFANAAIVYSVTKVAGYLGATGYANLIFLTNSFSSNAFVGTLQGFG